MPDQSEFDTTLNVLADYVEDIGDQILQENIENILTAEVKGEEYFLTGHRCEGKENSIYIVAGHPDLRYFHVVYALSLGRNIGTRLDEEAIDALV